MHAWLPPLLPLFALGALASFALATRLCRLSGASDDSSPEGLAEHTAQLAKELGIGWSGSGGVARLVSACGRPVWRVYSERAALGAMADVDVATGEVLCIQEGPCEAQRSLPEDARPSAAEAAAFLKAKMERVHWRWPEAFTAEWRDGQQCWRIRSASMSPGEGFRAEVEGGRDSLHIRKMCRV